MNWNKNRETFFVCLHFFFSPFSIENCTKEKTSNLLKEFLAKISILKPMLAFNMKNLVIGLILACLALPGFNKKESLNLLQKFGWALAAAQWQSRCFVKKRLWVQVESVAGHSFLRTILPLASTRWV